MADNVRLCPFCKKGEVRIHRRVAEEQSNKPFWEKVENNELVCDTCAHIIHDNELMERLSTDGEAKTKERRCSSCDKMKTIVFERWDFRL
jgi:C4-type Zn-finger protein